MIVMVNWTYYCFIVNITILVFVCICLKEYETNFPKEWFISLNIFSFFPRCLFSNKTVKTTWLVYLICDINRIFKHNKYTHVLMHLHVFIEKYVRLICLTSSILTPDALFALLSLYISYASYSTLQLLIIQMIFFFALCWPPGKKRW
jgi:hypothetical protein